MKQVSSSATDKPFAQLRDLIARSNITLSEMKPQTPPRQPPPPSSPAEDRRLFLDAMAGVRRLKQDKCVAPPATRRRSPPGYDAPGDAECRRRLEDLIQTGNGFVVSQTPEYIEGSALHSHPALARRLHRGRFSIQDHVDLHGLAVEDARKVFDVFLKRSVQKGHQGVLVVHGRGLSSPGRPVLKSNLVKWLSTAPWRKWISAYASARLCDGGAGATYILLRDRPQKKSRTAFPA